jgi:hypothetical protein
VLGLRGGSDKVIGELDKPFELSAGSDGKVFPLGFYHGNVHLRNGNFVEPKPMSCPVWNKKKAEIGKIEFSLKFGQSSRYSTFSSSTLLSEKDTIARIDKLGLSSTEQAVVEFPLTVAEVAKEVEDNGSDFQLVYDQIEVIVKIVSELAKVRGICN